MNMVGGLVCGGWVRWGRGWGRERWAGASVRMNSLRMLVHPDLGPEMSM